jgi:predicted metal-binding membrane protein
MPTHPQAQPSGGPPSLRRRDRIAILSALAATTVIAWAYLVKLALGMEAMGEMALPEAMQICPWSARDFGLMFLMWAVMMVGMMLPTVAPTVLVYAAVAGKARGQGATAAPTAAFVWGYVAVWTLFSVAATVAQWAPTRPPCSRR